MSKRGQGTVQGQRALQYNRQASNLSRSASNRSTRLELNNDYYNSQLTNQNVKTYTSLAEDANDRMEKYVFNQEIAKLDRDLNLYKEVARAEAMNGTPYDYQDKILAKYDELANVFTEQLSNYNIKGTSQDKYLSQIIASRAGVEQSAFAEQTKIIQDRIDLNLGIELENLRDGARKAGYDGSIDQMVFLTEQLNQAFLPKFDNPNAPKDLIQKENIKAQQSIWSDFFFEALKYHPEAVIEDYLQVKDAYGFSELNERLDGQDIVYLSDLVGYENSVALLRASEDVKGYLEQDKIEELDRLASFQLGEQLFEGNLLFDNGNGDHLDALELFSQAIIESLVLEYAGDEPELNRVLVEDSVRNNIFETTGYLPNDEIQRLGRNIFNIDSPKVASDAIEKLMRYKKHSNIFSLDDLKDPVFKYINTIDNYLKQGYDFNQAYSIWEKNNISFRDAGIEERRRLFNTSTVADERGALLKSFNQGLRKKWNKTINRSNYASSEFPRKLGGLGSNDFGGLDMPIELQNHLYERFKYNYIELGDNAIDAKKNAVDQVLEEWGITMFGGAKLVHQPPENQIINPQDDMNRRQGLDDVYNDFVVQYNEATGNNFLANKNKISDFSLLEQYDSSGQSLGYFIWYNDEEEGLDILLDSNTGEPFLYKPFDKAIKPFADEEEHFVNTLNQQYEDSTDDREEYDPLIAPKIDLENAQRLIDLHTFYNKNESNYASLQQFRTQYQDSLDYHSYQSKMRS